MVKARRPVAFFQRLFAVEDGLQSSRLATRSTKNGPIKCGGRAVDILKCKDRSEGERKR